MSNVKEPKEPKEPKEALKSIVEPKTLKTVTEMRPFHINTSAVEAAAPCRATDNIMAKVEAFFSKPEHMGKLLPFLHGTSKISLRMVEWFVFVYCSTRTVDWFIGEDYFNVYLDYQTEMGDNKKQRFDPMGRKWRKETRKLKNGEITTVNVYHGINFYYTDEDFIVTSVAQLNFFRWFIGKGVLDYMLEHYDTLAVAMNKYNKDAKVAKTAKIAKGPSTAKAAAATDTDATTKNKKVRVQAVKRVTMKNVEVFVSFD
jgi:hypothetical protein